MKAYISLAQVNKITRVKISPKEEEIEFSLTYPPKFYMSILRKEVATSENFIKNWERVDNFTFLYNKYISTNEFLRLFLFNNSVLKIRLNDDETEGIKVSRSIERLDRMINKFEGLIQKVVI